MHLALRQDEINCLTCFNKVLVTVTSQREPLQNSKERAFNVSSDQN